MTADEPVVIKKLPSVYECIAIAQAEIAKSSFAKNGTVEGGSKYNYLKISDMLDPIRHAHGKAGVIPVFSRPEYDTENGEKRWSYEKTSRDGYKTTWQAAVAHVNVTIYGTDGSHIDTTVPCEAQDNSDKLTNKLMTNAERTLYRTLYAIDEGLGEDPEEINETTETRDPDYKEAAQADPFFGKPCTPAKAEKTAPVKTDADIEGEKAAERARARVAVPLDRNKVISAIVLAKLDKTNKEKVDSYLESRHCAKVADCTDAQLRDLIDDLGLKVGS